MTANLLMVSVSLLVGWTALYPLRGRMPAPLHQLAALPVGLLGWTIAPAVWTALGGRSQTVWVVAGLVAYAAVVAGLATLSRTPDPQVTGTGAGPYVAWGVPLAAAGALFALAGITVAGVDSYTHYELSGWYLWERGTITPTIIGTRNALLPAMHMATRLFGGDWTYAVYPMLSLVTAGLVAWAAWHLAYDRLETKRRGAATALTTVAMLAVPMWVFNTWHVHSNMTSAAMTTLALVALLSAAGALDRGLTAWDSAPAALVAGLATAGLALARPDGLAYAFQMIVVVFVLHMAGYVAAKAVSFFYAGLVLVTFTVYGGTLAGIGLWASDKLKGSWAVALLAAILLAWGTTLVAGRLKVLARLRRLPALLWLVGVANLLLLVAIALFRRWKFVTAVRNMAVNLFVAGGWGMLWYLALALLVASLFVVPLKGRRALWPAVLLLAALQFFSIAVAVHGAVHPGRRTWRDSFNRAAFHVLPTVFLYGAAYAGVLASPQADDPDDEVEA